MEEGKISTTQLCFTFLFHFTVSMNDVVESGDGLVLVSIFSSGCICRVTEMVQAKFSGPVGLPTESE